MKSKVLGKKLTLNKKTIIHLDMDKILNVRGGIINPTGPVDESVYVGKICVADTFGDSNCCY